MPSATKPLLATIWKEKTRRKSCCTSAPAPPTAIEAQAHDAKTVWVKSGSPTNSRVKVRRSA
jgi:hypothetical protein